MKFTYDTPADFVRHATRVGSMSVSWKSYSTSFLGSNASSINDLLARGGDESDVPEAMRLLEKLSLELPETEKAEFLPSVCGAYPCVPDAIQGLPESMRQRFAQANDGAPIKIGVIVTVSAGINQEAFRKRSAAILAIMYHLIQSGRAVELYAMHTMDGTDKGETILSVRIPSSPLSMAECNMVLGNMAFARRIPFTIGEAENGFKGNWARGFDHGDAGKAYSVSLAKREGFKMIIPPLHAAEGRQILENPADWMLGKYNAIQAAIDSEA